MLKPICCKSCSSRIASDSSGAIVISDLKVISAVEVAGKKIEIKCRSCNNWNTFLEGDQFINYTRKSQEALYHSVRKNVK